MELNSSLEREDVKRYRSEEQKTFRWLRRLAVSELAMAVLFVLMRAIRTHYDRVAKEVAVGPVDARLLPSRVRAVIMVQEINKPTMRAVNFARATRASTIEAVTVDDVLRVAQAHIHPEQLAIVLVGDHDKVGAELEAAGIAAVDVITDEPEGASTGG